MALQLGECNKVLEELPKAVTEDPASYVLTLVTEFCRDITRYVNGGETHAAALVQANRQTYAEFKRTIRSTAPPFVPYPNTGNTQGAANHKQFLRQFDENDEEEEHETSPDPKETPLYLDDVRNHIRLSLSRELPHNVPYASKVTLIEAFQASWKEDARKCFDKVYHTFENTLLSLINQKFKRYDNLKVHISCVYGVKYMCSILIVFLMDITDKLCESCFA